MPFKITDLLQDAALRQICWSLVSGPWLVLLRSEIEVLLEGGPQLPRVAFVDIETGKYTFQSFGITVQRGVFHSSREATESTLRYFDLFQPCLGILRLTEHIKRSSKCLLICDKNALNSQCQFCVLGSTPSVQLNVNHSIGVPNLDVLALKTGPGSSSTFLSSPIDLDPPSGKKNRRESAAELTSDPSDNEDQGDTHIWHDNESQSSEDELVTHVSIEKHEVHSDVDDSIVIADNTLAVMETESVVSEPFIMELMCPGCDLAEESGHGLLKHFIESESCLTPELGRLINPRGSASPRVLVDPQKCRECLQVFDGLKRYLFHVRTHHGLKNCTCVECGGTFPTLFEKALHSSLVHQQPIQVPDVDHDEELELSERALECSQCRNVTHSIQDLVDHNRVFHKECKETQCPSCSMLQPSAQLMVHFESCSKLVSNQKYSAEELTRVEAQLQEYQAQLQASQLKRHQRPKESPKLWVPLNPLQTWSKSEEMEHCSPCSKTFSSGGSFLLHVRDFHRDKYRQFESLWEANQKGYAEFNRHVTCGKCSLVVNGYEMMNIHREMMHSLGSFPCQPCNKAFLTQLEHDLHMNLTHEEPFTGILNPGSGRNTFDVVKDNGKVATEFRDKNKCPFCSELFKQKNSLRRHLHLLHGRKHLNCLVCRESAKFTHQLVSHYKLFHLDVASDICCFCGIEVTLDCFETHVSNCIAKKFRLKDRLKVLKKMGNTKAEERSPSIISKHCQICDFKTSSGTAFEKHVQEHDTKNESKDGEEHNCTLCPRKLPSERCVQLHLQYFHETNPNPTSLQDTAGTCAEGVNLEPLAVEEVSPRITWTPLPGCQIPASLNPDYNCAMCEVQSRSLREAVAHIKRRHLSDYPTLKEFFVDGKEFFHAKECDVCTLPVNGKWMKQIHMHQYHSLGDFTCLECHRGFLTRMDKDFHSVVIHQVPFQLAPYPVHERIITDGKIKTQQTEYQCLFCDQAPYSNLGSNRSHMKRAHNLANFPCPLCFGTTFHASFLLVHIQRFHPEVDQIPCPMCCDNIDQGIYEDHCLTCVRKKYKPTGNTFQIRSTRQKEGCICDLCGKVFKSQSAVHYHTKVMHNSKARMYQCEKCEFRTRNKRTFFVHINSHLRKSLTTEEERLKSGMYSTCEHCGKSIVTRHLIRHIRAVHLYENYQECPKCGKGFKYGHRQLRGHMLSVHKIKYVPAGKKLK